MGQEAVRVWRGQPKKSLSPEQIAKIEEVLPRYFADASVQSAVEPIISQRTKMFGKKWEGAVSQANKVLMKVDKGTLGTQAQNIAMGLSPEGDVKNLLIQTGRLGIHQDEIIPLMAKGDFKGIRKMVKGSAKQLAEEKSLAEATIQAESMFANSKLVKNIVEDKTMDIYEKHENIIKLINIGQKKLLEATEIKPMKGLLAKVSAGFNGIETNMGKLQQYFNEVGYNYPARLVGKMSDFVRESTPLRHVEGMKFNYIKRYFQAMPENKQRAIEHYIKYRDLSKRRSYAEIIGTQGVMANPEMIPVIEAKYGYRLNYEDMVDANKIASAFRHNLWLGNQLDNGMYDAHRFVPKDFDSIDGRDIVHLDKQLKGDRGGNYFPGLPTKEFREQMLGKGEEFYELKEAIDNRNYSGELKFYEKYKKQNSVIDQDDSKRALPGDAINAYLNSFMDANVRRRGERILNEVKMSVFMPLGNVTERNVRDEHKLLDLVANQWHNNMNPASYKDQSALGKAFSIYAEWAIPLALTSPRMAVVNSFQAFFTAGQQHGYIPELLNTLKFQTKLASEVVMNPARYKNAFDKIANGDFDKPLLKGLDGTFGENFQRYQFSRPGLYMMDEDQIAEIIGKINPGRRSNEMVKEIRELITFPFQGSDKVSRAAGFYSATEHGANALDNLLKNLKNGMAEDDAVAALAKELHLGSFSNFNDMRYVLESLDLKNIKQTGKEFLYRYSDRSVRQELFDYSSMGQSYLKGWAKAKSPSLGLALTFQSWPMYFHELTQGAINAWKMGDTKPMARMVAMGGVTYLASISAMGEDSEPTKKAKKWIERKAGGFGKVAIKEMESYPAYIKNRAPFTSYKAFAEKMVASPAGILTPIIGTGLYSVYQGELALVKALAGSDAVDKDPLKFFAENAKNHMESEVTWRKALQISRLGKDAGLWDMDLREYLKEK